MIRGIIEFKGEKCTFDLDETNFLLEIEIITNRGEDKEYARTFGSLKPKDNLFEGLLVGETFDKGKFVYFNIYNINQTNHNQFQGIVKSYLLSNKLFSHDTALTYEALEIQADELDHFYQPSQAYSFEVEPDKIAINPEDENTERFSFDFSENNVEAKLFIRKTMYYGSVSPLSATTSLNLSFNEKTELSFAEDLALLTRRFLMFITFRRNVNITKLILKRRKELDETIFESIGEFFINTRDYFVEETDEKVRRQQVIDYELIKNHLSNLLMNLANKEVYMSHLPETIQDSRLITPARYIMVTAGFEWEFSRSLDGKLSHDTNTKYTEEIQDISDFFDKRIQEASGKQKRFYRNTKKRALGDVGQSHTLQQRLTFAFEEFDEVLNDFIKNIFSYNGVEFESNYCELAQRIAERRNAVGHGNIAKEAHEWHGIDMLILEWLYYAMLLRSIGMDDHNIKKSINKLFRRGFAI